MNEEGGTALHVALVWARPRIRIAEALIHAQSDVNASCPGGDTPLLKAILAMAQSPSVPTPVMPSAGDMTSLAMFHV
eukprot:5023061-Amphidinium_carterae.1